jgi:RNA polymerase sigma-70 factor (sigma-E family)
VDDGPEGFAEFAAQTTRSLFRTALLLTGDWHLAEDLVQDTLARMFRLWSGISAVGNPPAYARTVLVRTFLSHRRRRSSRELPSAELPETAVTPPDAALRSSLIAALQTLPERQRAVIVLRYLADRSVEDVAATLGRSPGAIRVQSMRALARLRTALGSDLLDLTRT